MSLHLHGLVLGLLPGLQAGRDTLDDLVQTTLVEERHAVPVLVAHGGDDAVQRRRVELVGPARHHVADVHDEGVRDRLDGMPRLRRSVKDLQAADWSWWQIKFGQ